MDAEARKVAGIGESLLRLSVGIEAKEDLVADIVQALDRVVAIEPSTEVLQVAQYAY
jgi:cystathionine gamma-synthase